jgi:phosphoglucomutase
MEYGFSKEKGISVVKTGRSGAEEIEAMMKNFRSNPLKQIAGSKVTLIKDFATLKAQDLNLNETFTLEMPTTSNVLQYMAEDGTKVSIRPSGTEPKIKFYIEAHSNLASRADYDRVDKEADEKIEQICKDLGI